MLSQYDDFIGRYYDELCEADCLQDLSDQAKDEAVYIFLMTHKTWFDDIYPVTFGRGVGKIATEMLFGKTPANSKLVSSLFIAMVDDYLADADREELWYSEALNIYLDELVHLGNFADEMRERIYLYVESYVEDDIFTDFVSVQKSIERENGIYRCEVKGNS